MRGDAEAAVVAVDSAGPWTCHVSKGQEDKHVIGCLGCLGRVADEYRLVFCVIFSYYTLFYLTTRVVVDHVARGHTRT